MRDADLPIELTRRMAHAFVHTPEPFTAPQALRRAQVLGLGGSEALADGVNRAGLALSFKNDRFWTTVIRFFVANPSLDHVKIRRIVLFLDDQKFTPRRGLTEDGREVEHPPPRPNLSMKGRTVRSLLRQVEAWRRHPRPDWCGYHRWNPIGVRGLHVVEEGVSRLDRRIWVIQELLDSTGLAEEGSRMDHCVADYVPDCVKGESSIWSLSCITTWNGRERVATIEVEPRTRSIVEALGRRNAPISAQARALMERWARQAGLTIHPWV
jgi:hypothetical protein